MTFEEWMEKKTDVIPLTIADRFLAQEAWQAAQTDLIQKAWNMYGEDLAEGLMDLAGITVDCPPEEEKEDDD